MIDTIELLNSIVQFMNLNLDQIPNTIETVEELIAWAGLLLHRMNGSLKCLENPNFSDYVCQASNFMAEDKTERLVIRVNLQLKTDYASSGRKFWKSVEEFSEITIPTEFLS